MCLLVWVLLHSTPHNYQWYMYSLTYLPPTCLDQQLSWGMPLLCHDLFQLPDPGECPYDSETNIPKQHNHEKVTDISARWYTTIVMSLIIGTIQLFEHPLFQEWLIVVFQAFENPHLKLLSQYRTPTPCRAWTGIVKCLLAFDSFYGGTVRVTQHLLAYYRHFPMSTTLLQSFWIASRLLLSLRSLNGGCQMCTSLRQSLWSSNGGCQMCTSFQQSLWSSSRVCQTRTNLWQSLQSWNGSCQMSLQSLNGG